MHTLHVLQTKQLHVFEQLKIEEAILRSSDINLCLINQGSPRAIIMGISNKPEELLDVAKVKRDRIPVIQRFSGGGTVIVDENTLFVTFIFAKNALPVHPFPESILRWSADLYAESWQIPHFHLIENDYSIGQKKCGGNAQYIQKERLLHHTTFLWDYAPENMDYLLLPTKRPQYRNHRTHDAFLCRLNQHAKSPEQLTQKLLSTLTQRFVIEQTEVSQLRWGPHRQSLRWIDL